MRLTARLLPLLASLVACSGGGGGSSTPTQTPTQNTPSPAAENVSLQMSETNAVDVANYGAGLIENTLELASLATNLLQATSLNTEPSRTDSCSNGGLVDFEFIDVDQNGSPSSGDMITAMYRDCFLPELNRTVAGDFSITVAENGDNGNGSLVQSGQINIDGIELADDLGNIISLEESFNFTFAASTLENQLSVSGSTVFLYDDGTSIQRDELNTFEFNRLLRKDLARYTITATGSVSSQVLQGQFEITTTNGIDGFLGTFPEQGSLDFIGADGGAIRMEANLVTNSGQADVRLDDGAGGVSSVTVVPWSDSTDGLLWSTSNLATDTEIREFDANRLELLTNNPQMSEAIGEVTGLPVNGPLSYQFSRQIEASSVPTDFELVLLDDSNAVVSNVQLDVQLDGAYLQFTPEQQLEHGRNYRGPIPVGQASFSPQDEFGNTLTISANNTFTSRNNLQSNITAQSEETIVAMDVIGLDANSSISEDGAIQSYTWSQTAGVPGVFSNTDQANTTFTVPSFSRRERIALQLEVRNAEDEVDTASFEFDAFETFQASTKVMHIEGAVGTVLNGQVFDSRQEAGVVNSIDLSSLVKGANFTAEEGESIDWAIIFAANNLINPGPTAPLTVGSYEMAGNPPANNNSPLIFIRYLNNGCDDFGRFDVLEIETDENGDLEHLAIDFQHECGTTNPSALTGSIRIFSSVPLP